MRSHEVCDPTDTATRGVARPPPPVRSASPTTRSRICARITSSAKPRSTR